MISHCVNRQTRICTEYGTVVDSSSFFFVIRLELIFNAWISQVLSTHFMALNFSVTFICIYRRFILCTKENLIGGERTDAVRHTVDFGHNARIINHTYHGSGTTNQTRISACRVSTLAHFDERVNELSSHNQNKSMDYISHTNRIEEKNEIHRPRTVNFFWINSSTKSGRNKKKDLSWVELVSYMLKLNHEAEWAFLMRFSFTPIFPWLIDSSSRTLHRTLVNILSFPIRR